MSTLGKGLVIGVWLGLGIAVLGGGPRVMALEVPLQVAQNNQSDVGGTNVGEWTSPYVEQGTVADPLIDQETVEAARQLAQALEEADAACRASQAAIAGVPRRFARGSAPADAACISMACEQLTRLTAEAQAFLSTLNRAQLEQLQQDPSLRLW